MNKWVLDSFFYFFFHEVYPQFETIPEDFKDLQSKDKSFYELIEQGHKRVIKDSGHKKK